MGRAELGRAESFDNSMGRAGLRPIVWKFDGPDRAATHHVKI